MLPRLLDPFSEMENTVGNFPALIHNGDFNQKTFVPAVDIYQTTKDVIVETTLPGVNPEQVVVSVEGGVLTIEGESKREHEIDEDNVSAEFEDGVLKITCPKADENKSKKISVKVVKKNK